MQLRSGDLTDLITFQRREGTQSPGTGAWSYVWIDVGPQEWAQVRGDLPGRSESVADGIALNQRTCRVRCRYRDDVTSAMRVKHGDRVLAIIAGPEMLGRREGLEMKCQDYSTEGEAP